MVHSAGVLPWHQGPEGVRVLVAHMGGPFWARKQQAAWSLAKGEFDPATESAQQAARREFTEETGIPLDGVELEPLGEFRVSSGKVLHAFCCRAPQPWPFVASNRFELEWPPRSGRLQSFPEVDRAEWLTPEQAELALVKGQRPVLATLVERLPEASGRS